MRYTKSEVEGMFARFVKALGKRIDGGSYNGLYLDYCAVYGGYVILEYFPNGSCDHPFGLLRRNAKEMFLSMNMATQAIEHMSIKEE